MSKTSVTSPEAAKWDWKADGGTPAAKQPMNIRVKAALQGAVMIAVGFVFFHWRHHLVGPAIIWTLAALVLCGGLFYPPLFHAFEKFGKKLGAWVATGMTYLLLVPFYYLVFAPAHWILNARHIDPMCREFPTKLDTYWIPRKPITDFNQYKKQH